MGQPTTPQLIAEATADRRAILRTARRDAARQLLRGHLTPTARHDLKAATTAVSRPVIALGTAGALTLTATPTHAQPTTPDTLDPATDSDPATATTTAAPPPTSTPPQPPPATAPAEDPSGGPTVPLGDGDADPVDAGSPPAPANDDPAAPADSPPPSTDDSDVAPAPGAEAVDSAAGAADDPPPSAEESTPPATAGPTAPPEETPTDGPDDSVDAADLDGPDDLGVEVVIDEVVDGLPVDIVEEVQAIVDSVDAVVGDVLPDELLPVENVADEGVVEDAVADTVGADAVDDEVDVVAPAVPVPNTHAPPPPPAPAPPAPVRPPRPPVSQPSRPTSPPPAPPRAPAPIPIPMVAPDVLVDDDRPVEGGEADRPGRSVADPLILTPRDSIVSGGVMGVALTAPSDVVTLGLAGAAGTPAVVEPIEWITTISHHLTQPDGHASAGGSGVVLPVSAVPAVGHGYAVVVGDSLWSISRKLWSEMAVTDEIVGATAAILYAYNAADIGPDPDHLPAGVVLDIPLGQTA